MSTCKVETCTNERARSQSMCWAHLRRRQKHGDIRADVPIRYMAPRGSGCGLTRQGYKYIVAKDHPLATKQGHVLEHRVVLYAKLNGQDAPCHWCQTPLRWLKGKLRPGYLCGDHLDGIKLNNTADNLVPSCAGCNTRRYLLSGNSVEYVAYDYETHGWPECAVPGCVRPAKKNGQGNAREMCSGHEKAKESHRNRKPCEVEGCDTMRWQARSMCRSHANATNTAKPCVVEECEALRYQGSRMCSKHAKMKKVAA